MGNLHSFSGTLDFSDNAKQLINKLRSLQWTGPISPKEIATVLGSRRLPGTLIQECIALKVLRQRSDGAFDVVHLPQRTGADGRAARTRNGFQSSEISSEKNTDSEKIKPVRRRKPSPSPSPSNLLSHSEGGTEVNFLRSDTRSNSKETERKNSLVFGDRPKTPSKDGIRNIFSKKCKQKKNTSRKPKESAEERNQKLAEEIRKKQKEKRITGKPTATLRLDEQVQLAKAQSMAMTYEEKLGLYQNKPALRFLKGSLKTSDRMYPRWLRAALHADQLGVSYEVYVRAQFYVMDAWYGRAPKPEEMSSYRTENNSLERCREYLSGVSAGEINPNLDAVSRTRTPFTVHKNKKSGNREIRFENAQISRSVRFTQSDMQLQTLMRNYDASAEDIFKVFAKGAQAALYFDREWLEQRQEYQRLRSSGEI